MASWRSSLPRCCLCCSFSPTTARTPLLPRSLRHLVVEHCDVMPLVFSGSERYARAPPLLTEPDRRRLTLILCLAAKRFLFYFTRAIRPRACHTRQAEKTDEKLGRRYCALHTHYATTLHAGARRCVLHAAIRDFTLYDQFDSIHHFDYTPRSTTLHYLAHLC